MGGTQRSAGRVHGVQGDVQGSHFSRTTGIGGQGAGAQGVGDGQGSDRDLVHGSGGASANLEGHRCTAVEHGNTVELGAVD
ncbi:MAG: hypothetical protein RR882_17295, partial [Comamonas sp.]